MIFYIFFILKFWDKKVRTENEGKISDVAIIVFHMGQKEFYYKEIKETNM